MPKQHRYAIKQNLQTIINELTKAEDKLVETGRLYKEAHPDIYTHFGVFLALLSELKSGITKLSDSI